MIDDGNKGASIGNYNYLNNRCGGSVAFELESSKYSGRVEITLLHEPSRNLKYIFYIPSNFLDCVPNS